MQATDFRYQVVPSKNLSESQHRDIDRLLWKSLEADFDGRDPYELASFVIQSALHRSDPNGAVGGRNLRAGQAYARSVLVLATDKNNELAASVPFADNASARKHEDWPPLIDKLAQTAERNAKLFVPAGRLHGKPLIQSRWGWFGQPAFSSAVRRESLEAGPEEFSVVHGLMAAVSHRVKVRQPASAYTFAEEHFWKQQLALAGFREQGEETAKPFDSDFETRVTTMRAPSFELIREWLLEMDGGEDALPHIRMQIVGHN